KNLIPGKFMGHPGGNQWYSLAKESMGEPPVEPESGSRFVIQADRIPEYEPPSILFPYKKMGQSASGIACDSSNGKFGPFTGQLFVGDQTNSTIMRCYLEKVQGHFQGACFPFREGFGSGTVGVEMTPQGSLFVGGTNRGWGSRGTKPFAIERLDWSGETPFEILKMEARPKGFRLTFTKPADIETLNAIEYYTIDTYSYIYQASYGSPEVDFTKPTITSAVSSPDGLSVELTLDQLERGHIHELKLPGVRDQSGQPLLHQEAYYTLNYIPAE
ncbi:MAG: hypothetical protein KDA78_00635, partial [Planctomycetaceae bacterium]|nr:hypothetical protein [Planctomycetaceae bacterium]